MTGDSRDELVLMHPEVDWPNGMEGGRVHGHDEVRAEPSERRIRSELAAGRKPKMTLRGQCKGTKGATVETATLHFKSGKSRTMIADAKTK